MAAKVPSSLSFANFPGAGVAPAIVSYLNFIGANISNWTPLVAARVNQSLPEDGSEQMTGALRLANFASAPAASAANQYGLIYVTGGNAGQALQISNGSSWDIHPRFTGSFTSGHLVSVAADGSLQDSGGTGNPGTVTSVSDATNGGLTVTNPTTTPVLALNINDLVTKTTPVGGDYVSIYDSAGAATKKSLISSLPFPIYHSQVFTANGTFTINSTAVKVTVVAGGGAGGGSSGANNLGGGGGSGGAAIKTLTGLTVGNTLSVTIGAGGTGVSNGNGNAGGTSSVASGTQTITTITTNGGSGGTANGFTLTSAGGAGGTVGSGGDLNLGGNSQPAPTTGAGSIFGGGPLAPTTAAAGNAGTAPGAGGSGSNSGGGGASQTGGAGLAGVVIFEWVT